jgi:hypothetical protein
MEFNFNKYLKNNPLLKEDEGSDMTTIELDMSWDQSDPEEDQSAEDAFAKFNIDVEESEHTGTYNVSGKKEDILAYLRSEFYEMDEETIQQYYPQLLDGEMEETSGYGNYTQPEKMLEDDDYDYQSAEDFDLDPQDGENDPLGPDEELMEGDTTAIDNFIDKLKSTTKKMAMKLKDSELEHLKSKLQKWADSGFDTTS